MIMPTVDEQQHAHMRAQVRERMVTRAGFVGSNERTAPQIEESFREGIVQLEAHLSDRPYLFGARPSFGDLGVWGQLYNAWTDPTPGALIEGRTPQVLAWIQRMLRPRAEGDFEPWSNLEPTLMPFLQRQIGARFLPWTLANAEAIAKGNEEFSVELNGQTWTQKPQKYHAKSLQVLREKYRAITDKSALDPVLERAGCLGGVKG
jgi:hypothetical protein